MRRVVILSLLAIVAYAHVNEQDSLDELDSKLVTTLIDRALKVGLLDHADLDDTAFAKVHPDKGVGTVLGRPRIMISYPVPMSTLFTHPGVSPFRKSPALDPRSLPVSHAHDNEFSEHRRDVLQRIKGLAAAGAAAAVQSQIPPALAEETEAEKSARQREFRKEKQSKRGGKKGGGGPATGGGGGEGGGGAGVGTSSSSGIMKVAPVEKPGLPQAGFSKQDLGKQSQARKDKLAAAREKALAASKSEPPLA